MQYQQQRPPQGKEFTMSSGGVEYKFLLRVQPYTGLDDLEVENRKNLYLQMRGIMNPDDETLVRARWLATCELIIVSGLQYERNPDDVISYARAAAIGALPPDVINAVNEAYFAQFSAPKNS